MSDVILCECFARDGLQHEADFVATETKRRLIERFAELGFPRVEATSYSNPKGSCNSPMRASCCSPCGGATVSTTRPPAPMCARSSVRLPISMPASA
jgi:isopropylmalate/homocitrate/citramalate synthase